MNTDTLHKISSVAASMIGGVVGTAIIHKEMELAGRLPERFQMPDATRDPGDFIVEKAESITGHALAPATHDSVAQSLSWVYGIGWATALGTVAMFAPARTLKRATLMGIGLGAIVYGAGYLGWLPLAGITQPVHRQPTKHLASLVGHVIYGLVAVAPIYAAFRMMPRRARLGIVLRDIARSASRRYF